MFLSLLVWNHMDGKKKKEKKVTALQCVYLSPALAFYTFCKRKSDFYCTNLSPMYIVVVHLD